MFHVKHASLDNLAARRDVAISIHIASKCRTALDAAAPAPRSTAPCRNQHGITPLGRSPKFGSGRMNARSSSCRPTVAIRISDPGRAARAAALSSPDGDDRASHLPDPRTIPKCTHVSRETPHYELQRLLYAAKDGVTPGSVTNSASCRTPRLHASLSRPCAVWALHLDIRHITERRGPSTPSPGPSEWGCGRAKR